MLGAVRESARDYAPPPPAPANDGPAAKLRIEFYVNIDNIKRGPSRRKGR
jgi:hypothetical protein